MTFHQLGDGNLDVNSKSTLCGDYYNALGFDTNSTGPQRLAKLACQCIRQPGEIEVTAPSENYLGGGCCLQKIRL